MTGKKGSTLAKFVKDVQRAGVPLAAVESPDQNATIAAIAKTINGDGEVAKLRWDFVRGVEAVQDSEKAKLCVGMFVVAGIGDVTIGNPVTLLDMARKLPDGVVLFVVNAHSWIEGESGAAARQAIHNLRDAFKEIGNTLYLLAPHFRFAPELSGDIEVYSEQLPTREELADMVGDLCEQGEIPLNPKSKADAVDGLIGLSSFRAEQVAALSARQSGLDIEVLWERKKQAIGQTPGLSIDSDSFTFADIGGHERVKEFGRLLFSGPKPPTVIVRVEEIEKVMGGASGDTSGTSQDALQVLLSGMEDNDFAGVIAYGPPGCQPAGSKVLMGDGQWREIQDIRLGDLVMSPQRDGPVTTEMVVGVASYLDQPTYEIAIKGGKRYRCSGDHIVPHLGFIRPRENGIRKGRARVYREYTVDTLLAAGANYREKACVFTSPAVSLPEKQYTVHPYVVGAFLGDGSWSASKGACPSFTTADECLVVEMQRLGARYSVAHAKKGTKANSYNAIKEFRHALRAIGLEGVVGRDKKIPVEYMVGSLGQRLDLLAGLIDTDGTKDEWASISPTLTRQFVDLVHSVGGYAIARERTYTDALNRTYRHFRVHFSFGEHVAPTRLTYKRQSDRKMTWKNPRNKSFTISPIGQSTVYGFTLSGASQCYVTDDWIVTHNSGKSLFSKSLANTFDKPCINLDLNATKDSLVGSSEARVRQAFNTIKAIAGKGGAFFVATANKLGTVPPELRRRFRYGVWMFDLPTREERKAVWEINLKQFGIEGDRADLAGIDDSGFSGADIRSICELAWRTGTSLATAMGFIVLSRTSPEAIEECRKSAEGRFMSSAYPGMYKMPGADQPAAAKPRRKLTLAD